MVGNKGKYYRGIWYMGNNFSCDSQVKSSKLSLKKDECTSARGVQRSWSLKWGTLIFDTAERKLHSFR